MTIKKDESGAWVLDQTRIPDEARQEVEIFDTTLRDGEQGGVTFKGDSKFKIAQFLADTGVSTIEVGFPSSTPLEFDTVKHIADTVEGPHICGLTTMDLENIKRTWQAWKITPIPPSMCSP